LMSRYGAGTYELSGHSDGVFLAGRQTVIIGSYGERQTARHRHATHEGATGTGPVAQMQQWADVFKTLGLIPGEQQNDAQGEIMKMLMQNTIQSLRPQDPTEAMGQAFDFLKSVRQLEKAAPSPRPHPRPHRKRGAEKSSKDKRTKAVGEVLGTALFLGADLALRNPHMAHRMGGGMSTAARKAGDWLRRRGQTPSPTSSGADEPSTIDDAAMTLDEALASAMALAQTPVGRSMLKTIRAAIPTLSPEGIARQGLDGARVWLGANHPLLLRLREDSGRVFDEMADIVGLIDEPRWRARGYFLSIMAEEEARTATRTAAADTSDGESSEGNDDPPPDDDPQKTNYGAVISGDGDEGTDSESDDDGRVG
ncbi:MAG: hypothetical protein HOL45_00440, partial [Chloroflexi bacterium]|nr:hypothetical protein [Chloroflexota bacterium]